MRECRNVVCWMRKSRKVLVVAAVIFALLAFFFLPLIPYQSSYYSVAPNTLDRWNAHVSASYFIFKCGIALDIVLGTGTNDPLPLRPQSNQPSFTYRTEPLGSMFICFFQPSRAIVTAQT